jgi:hypothetical protein
MICIPLAEGVYVTVHFVPLLFSLQDTVPNVPAPELENSTVPGNFELSADFTVAVHIVIDPTVTLLGLHFTVVVVGTSWVEVEVTVVVVVVGDVEVTVDVRVVVLVWVEVSVDVETEVVVTVLVEIEVIVEVVVDIEEVVVVIELKIPA